MGGTYSTQSPRISSDFGTVSPILNIPPLTLCSMKEIAFQILQIGRSISQTENKSSSPGRNPICPEQLRGRGFPTEWLSPSSAAGLPLFIPVPLSKPQNALTGPPDMLQEALLILHTQTHQPSSVRETKEYICKPHDPCNL